jgi:multidrug transporter EmrE-like cation transporter
VLDRSTAGAGEEQVRPLGKKLLFHGLCLVQFFFNGMTSIVSKAHSISPNGISSRGFTLLSGVLQAVLALTVLLCFAARERGVAGKGALRRIFVDVTKSRPTTARALLVLAAFGFGYALCNGLANVSSNECARTMDASIQYPAITAVVIVLTAVLGRIFFGEKITKSTLISLMLSMSGAILFMFA